MSLLIYIVISLIGIGIVGLGLVIQKATFNIVGLLSLLLGTSISILSVLLAALFLETYPAFLFMLPVI
ncbi:hypothetical protein [Methanolobus sp.]|uniref:hypothetical protein n=1 Tax=Methanolobus sp. TaxID=1874737 RepID=UPI0025D476C3|nr:hypothetical protein [Methanolobus sp.]